MASSALGGWPGLRATTSGPRTIMLCSAGTSHAMVVSPSACFTAGMPQTKTNTDNKTQGIHADIVALRV